MPLPWPSSQREIVAPEQANGEDLDERADVYALGAILYNLLAGAPPYFDKYGDAGSTRIADVPEAQPGAGQVLLRVLEVGVCGTDREISEGAFGLAPTDAAELVLGHELLGALGSPRSRSPMMFFCTWVVPPAMRPPGAPSSRWAAGVPASIACGPAR